ncbi:hypothetical protein UNOSLW4_0190 [Pseudomonas phage UNO-SLW4]|uniref:Internal virion protein B n=5 Tax=Unosvirus TaxID=3424968 RepID=A0A1B2AN20_9CAUD|nr:internal virion protein [Pseudomonas phage UNO-SLW1]ANY29053.1 hypothetical protein UNOSLW4_0190 [Pseudomonas phage UNO-SLW4]ANY29100.1 hypothetical protein UNOSLW3_0195 [Pseudomonas phage UNO-SLW3]ANY29147.1 hypothetical protein UNOSLW2_0195 [Pseudomonas phage UNO-SLW2]UBU95734.1 protein inside capsid B [Pseudomonas phage PCS4]UPW35231.1 protein inside capsid B [Pseudomonas phage PCS5]UZZ63900.1 internal virion protein [Pseudomonas phage PSV6]WCD55491.1 hypothetical protein KKMOLJDB_0000
MCEPVSIMMAVGAAAGLASGAMGAKQQAKAEGAAEDARRANGHEQILAMHRADADMNLETQDKHLEARSQLTETNLTALRNRGTVRAAIAESGMEGNTMDRVQRDVENQASHEKMAILDNYERDYATIFQNKVANVENTKAALRGSRSAVGTSKLAQALNVASSTLSGASAGAAMGSQYKSATAK